MKDLCVKSVLAGLLIGFAGALYLQCVAHIENKSVGVIMGAILFSLGLLSVILFKTNLFTGKVGYITTFREFWQGMIMLVLNLLAAFALGLLYKLCIGESAALVSRFAKEWYRILFDSVICGMCVFLSVDLYKRTSNIFTIILPVVAFIIFGGEHCIAFAFYIGSAPFDAETGKALLYLLIMIAGNSIGALLLRALSYHLIDKPKETA